MSRSRAHASRSSEPSKVPAWVWLFTGAVLGAFVMFLMHLSDVSPNNGNAGKSKNVKVSKKDAVEKPRFDFYDLLKQSDVPVYEDEKKPIEKTVKAAPTQEFLLQVASFKSAPDAERLRAELILLNLHAYTEDAKIRNGETWHRVIVGPFTSRSKLSKARSILLSNRHEALVLKRQPEG